MTFVRRLACLMSDSINDKVDRLTVYRDKVFAELLAVLNLGADSIDMDVAARIDNSVKCIATANEQIAITREQLEMVRNILDAQK